MSTACGEFTFPLPFDVGFAGLDLVHLAVPKVDVSLTCIPVRPRVQKPRARELLHGHQSIPEFMPAWLKVCFVRHWLVKQHISI